MSLLSRLLGKAIAMIAAKVSYVSVRRPNPIADVAIKITVEKSIGWRVTRLWHLRANIPEWANWGGFQYPRAD